MPRSGPGGGENALVPRPPRGSNAWVQPRLLSNLLAQAEGAPEARGFLGRTWRLLGDRLESSPGLVAMLGLAFGLWALAMVLMARGKQREETSRLNHQWTFVLGVVVVLLFLLLLLPIHEDTKSEIVKVLGVVLPAAVALSATAFLGNLLGGLVLQRTAPFKLGDFIQVGEHFGRVSERTLMNTQIQNEDRDLTTLPNLMLVTQPVKVVRRSGTIASATVSLGYDIPWPKIEAALLEAAKRADLEEPFVQVMDLGNFSVVYRAAGLCSDVRSLLAVRANLRVQMLDCLHGAGIEILSPEYTTARILAKDAPSVVPEPKSDDGQAMVAPPTELIFDKADTAQTMEQMVDALNHLENLVKDAKGEERKSLEERRDALKAQIAALEEELDEEAE